MMTYEQGIKKIDFLNRRMQKLKTPWYKWSIKITWDKINKWCRYFNYKGGKGNEK